jgi:thymidylate synthase
MAKIDIAYHKLLQEIKQKGFKYEDPNRKNVYRYQIPNYQIQHNFSDGFPAITTKKLYWKGIVGELLWFLKGDTNIKYLLDNNINIWNKDAYNYYCKNVRNPLSFEIWLDNIKSHNLHETSGDLGKVYGAQWRNWKSYNQGFDEAQRKFGDEKQGLDQFSNLIKGLKETPMGTKHIVTAWNPAELDEMALPPCHWSFEILVEPLSVLDQTLFVKDNSKKGWTVKAKRPKYQFTLKWHQRSVDTFLGQM